MRPIVAVVSVLMLFSALGGSPLTAQTWNILNVPLLGQETPMWCWAASGEMIMTYMGSSVSQGAQANSRFGRSDCTNRPPPSSCAIGGWWEPEKWGYSVTRGSWGSALSFNQLKTEINSNRPVFFSWGWTGGGGHAMVATGWWDYLVGSSGQWVWINNPWPPSTFINLGIFGVYEINGGESYWVYYPDWVAKSGSHVHWWDFYNVRR